ncbi:hypothetical protein ACZ91_05520 [Streptomyces regensis]|nr:hypothetical protein ACZ91_05520 [Streptomyces regensis]
MRGTCLVDRRCEPNVAGESGRCAMRDAVRELLDAVDGRSDAMERAATTLLDCIDAGGVVHTAGAGHSVAMVCETFYRAGGLAAVRPLWDPEVVPLDGARAPPPSGGVAPAAPTTCRHRGSSTRPTSAVPPGDAVHPADAPRTSAVSTILGAYTWSALLAQLHRKAGERGSVLPLWTSANVPGGDEHNAELFARYSERIPELTAGIG